MMGQSFYLHEKTVRVFCKKCEKKYDREVGSRGKLCLKCWDDSRRCWRKKDE